MDALDAAAIWRRKETLRLWDAAVLAAGDVPNSARNPKTDAHIPLFHLIAKAAINGELGTVQSPKALLAAGHSCESAGINATAKIDELISFLKREGLPLGFLVEQEPKKKRHAEGQRMRHDVDRLRYLEFALAVIFKAGELPRNRGVISATAIADLAEKHADQWPNSWHKMPTAETGAEHIRECLRMLSIRKPPVSI